MKVKFIPQNIEVEVTPDKTLLQIANENNIEIKSICKGVPSCAECRVYIVAGEHNIVSPGKAELSLIGTSYYIDSRRLACQVHCFGDVTVDLTEQIERQANQTKKVRGYRTSRSMESKAVQDTMILNEKIETESSQTTQEPREPRAPREQREPKPQRQQQGRRQNQGQGQGQNRQQQKPKNPHQNQLRPQQPRPPQKDKKPQS